MRQRDERRGTRGFVGVLARAGYALAGAFAAALAGWVASLAFPSPHPGMFALFVEAAAMATALMLWASFKPSRLKGGSVALEALLVVLVVMAMQMVDSSLRVPDMLGYTPSPLLWVWDHAVFMLYSGLAFVLPAAWALGSGERWPRRQWGWVVGELVFALVAGMLLAGGALDFLTSSLPGMAVYGLVSVVVVLAAAGVVQRLVCELVWRVRAGRTPA